MNHFELKDENQRLTFLFKKEKSLRRKLQIQLAGRDNRIEALYRALNENNIPIPEVKASRNLKQLQERMQKFDPENILEQLADDQFGGKPNEGTINFGYERGRHDGFKEALREFII